MVGSLFSRYIYFLNNHGIEKQKPIIYTPQQNGVVVRTNCTIVETANSLFHA